MALYTMRDLSRRFGVPIPVVGSFIYAEGLATFPCPHNGRAVCVDEAGAEVVRRKAEAYLRNRARSEGAVAVA